MDSSEIIELERALKFTKTNEELRSVYIRIAICLSQLEDYLNSSKYISMARQISDDFIVDFMEFFTFYRIK